MRRLSRQEVVSLLRDAGIEAKRSLSQNFLVDPEIVEAIVDEAGVKEGDWVLEIGPGPGTLTRGLLAKGAHVVGVEIDKRFEPILPQSDQFHLFFDDFTQFPLEKLDQFSEMFKVVANIPYHITAPIMKKLAVHSALFSDVYLMVEDVVGENLVLGHEGKKYNAFDAMVGFLFTSTKVLDVPPEHFVPPPRANSQVIHLAKHPVNEAQVIPFFHFLDQAFAGRRKMLRGNLREFGGARNVEAKLEELALKPTSRAQDLTPHQLFALFVALSGKSAK
ncbi:MAG: Ribosomal RNA small subunit methyltransferase A [Chlamydiia bacterium]|nr:Ribosomal RNA small subunit methyltransferase A [Chlamydiia bacterium]